MATNAQFPGFLPTGYGTGGSISYVRRRVLTNNTTAIGLQDLVTADTNGDILGVPVGALATAVDTCMMGVSYVDANSQRIGAKNLPAATTYTSSGVNPANATFVSCVENAPLVKFRASIDAATVLADLRANYSILGAAPVNGVSRQEISGSSKNNTATLPVRLLEILDIPGESDPDTADCHVLCTINAGFTEPALTTTGLS
jgi:hypothetical protein